MKKKIWIYLTSFLAPLALMLVGWYINDFFPFGEKSFLAIDFNQQFVDLYIFMRNAIYAGDWRSFFYSFTKTIGGNMIGAWAYYMMSPFNIFYIIVPMKLISYAIFLSVWLRYGVMGLAMAYYLVKRHKGELNPFLTVALSTAYALNGFAVSYQMTPIFMDALWLMPLVLVALEKVLDGEKAYSYVLLLAFTMVIQFYLGYMICLFIFIYTFYYLYVKYSQEYQGRFVSFAFQRVLRLGLLSVLGIGLSAVILLPNINNLLFSKGALESTMAFDFELQINPFDILAKLMIGAFDNESWSAGPNLPNIYIGSLAMVGFVAYFLDQRIKGRHKLASLAVLTIFFFSITHEFTSKVWHMGQNPAGFFYRFSWILVFFLLVLAYQGLKDRVIQSSEVLIGLGLAFLVQAVVMVKEYSFLTTEQMQVSVFIFGAVWLIYFFAKNHKLKWALLLILSFSELSANAYLSQNRLNHNNAYKFENALSVIGQAIDKVRPPENDFYRISKTFYRSKNDPMTFNYPGMTNFASSLEGTTRDLFENLGNSGIDAAIYYYGTPLTDALLSVKYFVNNEPFTSQDQAVLDKTYVFPTDVTRMDILDPVNRIGETDRFSLYQVPKTLPIAFGVSGEMAKLHLVENQPIANQNAIGRAMLGKDVLTEVETEMALDNLGHGATDTGDQIYDRQDPSREAALTLSFTPDSDDAYFINIPKSVSTYQNEVDLLINNENYDYRAKFGSDQVFNIAYQAKGKPQEFKLVIKADRQFNLTQLKVYQMDLAKVNQLIDQGAEEGLKVEKWGSNFVKGDIQINDSTWVYTSIPYDKGWQVKVDGKKVAAEKIWDSLLGFRIEPGQHKVEMTFIPRGILLGSGLSLASLLLLLGLARFESKRRLVFNWLNKNEEEQRESAPEQVAELDAFSVEEYWAEFEAQQEEQVGASWDDERLTISDEEWPELESNRKD